jgi:hypothetical protein
MAREDNEEADALANQAMDGQGWEGFQDPNGDDWYMCNSCRSRMWDY